MSFVDETRELFPQPPTPHALIGAASPLWGFFAATAAGGVAWWWMTQWTRPRNLEAMFSAAGKAAAADAVPLGAASEPATVAAIVEPELPAAPVGGEAGPIAPALDAAAPVAPSVAVLSEAATEASAALPAPRASVEPRSVAPKAKATPGEPKSV